jgi:hypothetical protein
MKQGYGSEYFKEMAVRTLRTWLDAEPLEHFDDPKRAGTSRGEKIGMGRNKITAAGLLILHPMFSQQEISKIAGVSYGLLRKWKTEEDFQVKMQQLAHNFGTDIARCVVAVNVEEYLLHHKAESGQELSWTEMGEHVYVLKSQESIFNSFLKSTKSIKTKKKKVFIIDDGPKRWTRVYQQKYSQMRIMENLMPLLPWYEKGVAHAFAKFIKSYVSIPGVAANLMMLNKVSLFWGDFDKAWLSSWMTKPEMLDLWETIIADSINWLTNRLAEPNRRNITDSDKNKEKELAGQLQNQIRLIFELLRNKT